MDHDVLEPASPASTIAGMRVVRVLPRHGDREVVLVQGAALLEAHLASGDARGALAREAAALSHVHHPHVSRVVDVATLDGTAVVLRLSVESRLGDWLAARGRIEPGEAVTVLAPVLQAFAAMHEAGVTGAGASLHDVGIDADGAPVVMGVGAQRATARPTIAWRSASADVLADLAALAALIDTVLEAAEHAAPPGVLEHVQGGDPAAAADALLAAWPALPLQFAPRAERVPRVRRERIRERARGEGWGSLAIRALDEGARLVDRARSSLAGVRRGVWIAGAAGVAALALAGGLTAVAAPDAANESDAANAPGPPSASSTEPAEAPAAATSPPSPADQVVERDEAATVAPVADDDAARAALELLRLREGCIDASDAACLAPIIDPTGGIAASDAAWRLPADAVATVVGSYGDAVLVAIGSGTAPASVLIVSTEAGWILREAWAG